MKPWIPQALPIREVAWEALIPLIGMANRHLAEYNGVLYTMQNPELLLAPFTTQEAVLSSRIEGTQATLGEVLRYEAGEEPEVDSLNSAVADRHLRESRVSEGTEGFSPLKMSRGMGAFRPGSRQSGATTSALLKRERRTSFTCIAILSGSESDLG